MSRIFLFLQDYFWIFFLLGVGAGFLFPHFGSTLEFLLEPALMLMLLTVFLKLDVHELFINMQDIRRTLLQVVSFLVVLPIVVFFLFSWVDKTLALGFLLLASMPPGMSTPVLTDLVKGNTLLSTRVMVVCSLLSPFTISFLFFFLVSDYVDIAGLDMLIKLVLVIFVPLLLSFPIKHFFSKSVQRIAPYFSGFNVIIISLFLYIAIALEREFILVQPTLMIWYLFLLYIFFVVLHAWGYFFGFGHDRSERVTLAVSSAYVNNGLAIILATLFFPPSVVVLMILSEIPWGTLLGPFRKLVRGSSSLKH